MPQLVANYGTPSSLRSTNASRYSTNDLNSYKAGVARPVS